MGKKKGKDRPTILVVNDDGITAPGIKVLIEEMQQLGDVVVVAPEGAQAGIENIDRIVEPVIDTRNTDIRLLSFKNLIDSQLYAINGSTGTFEHLYPFVNVHAINA